MEKIIFYSKDKTNLGSAIQYLLDEKKVDYTFTSDEREFNEATLLIALSGNKDLSDVVMYLASDNSRYINGQTIRVDGGMKFE